MPHPLTADEQGFLCFAFMDDPSTLLTCYRFGIFPWDNVEKIGAFYFPANRYVIRPDQIKIPKSIRSAFNQQKFTITMDQHFDHVIQMCAAIKRKQQSSTWISPQFVQVYSQLHRMGYAHSVEVWQNKEMVGGLYGVAVGRVFTGESMFSLVSGASRFALISLAGYLVRHNFTHIDAQVYNPYLSSFGGQEISGSAFFQIMKTNLLLPDLPGPWEFK